MSEETKATPLVEKIWSELLVNSFSDKGPYERKNRLKKITRLIAQAIHLALEIRHIYIRFLFIAYGFWWNSWCAIRCMWSRLLILTCNQFLI